MGDMSQDEKDTRIVQREQFINDLMGFHAAIGTPLMRLPTINGHEIDLLGLYEVVTGMGGWERVSDNDQWPEVVARLDLPGACVNSSVALKQIYLRFLDKYEKNNFVLKIRGEPEDEVEFNIRRMNKQSARTLYGVPYTYNNSQHHLTEEQRLQLGLNALSERDRFDKILLSLISPLPNEQDFAINVCALLSLHVNDRPVDLRSTPRLLINLLAHAGVFTDVFFRDYLIEQYEKGRGYEVKDFWKNSLKHDAFGWLTCESNFSGTLDEGDCLMVDMPERSYMTENLVNFDAFIERICQVARIVLNLTQHLDNASFLARDITTLRFVLMCCDCRYKKISELGWDMMNSIASKLCLRTLGIKEITFLVKEGITSEDISEVLSSLRVLSELAKVESNITALLDLMDSDMFAKLCTYLTLQDVVIILCTLDALYNLSLRDKIFCDSIFRTAGSLSILVLLLRFRVPLSASFGTWKNIRVSESIVTEDSGRILAEKDLGALSVRPPEIPYPYYVNNPAVAPMDSFRRIESVPNCCVTGECRRSQKEDGPLNKDVITLQSSPRRNSMLCNALRNSVPNGVKPVTVSTVGPAITLKAHLEEPVTKIVKISNPGNQSLINTVKNMSHNNPGLLKNVGFVTKKMTLNGKEFVVATPMSPPPSKSSEESNSSTDDAQEKPVTNSNHNGGSEENSMDSVQSTSENDKKEVAVKDADKNGPKADLEETIDAKSGAPAEKVEQKKNIPGEKIEPTVDGETKDGESKAAPALVNGIQEEVKVNGVPEPDDYLCEWRGCLRKFKSANKVFEHIRSSHCPQTMLEGKCLWGSCTAGKMVYLILMKHIQREHCNPEVMLTIKARAALRPKPRPLHARRLQPPLANATPPGGPPAAPGPQPSPSVSGIMTASAPEQFNPGMSVPGSPLMPPPPPHQPQPPPPSLPPQHLPYSGPYYPRYYGPPPLANTPAGERIAESIRLTSALILRNIASKCPPARRRILLYEQQIVEAAALDSEASRAAAECLSYLWT